MAKKTEPNVAPRTADELAYDKENKSRDGRFASYERVPGKGLDGDLIIQHLGEPDAKTPPGDQ